MKITKGGGKLNCNVLPNKKKNSIDSLQKKELEKYECKTRFRS